MPMPPKSTRPLDPRKLDVRAFASAAATLAGETPQRDFARLAASLMPLPGDGAPPPVRWEAVGALRPVSGGAPQLRLHLQASTTVTLQCQRCLQPLAQPLAVDRVFRFVDDEEEAARLDEESEDEDVLCTPGSLDLPALIEDELILALPIVPRHEVCPEPLPLAVEAEDEAPNPFAALAALRKPPSAV